MKILPRSSHSLILLALTLALSLPALCTAQDQSSPNKALLIEQLKTTYALLEKGDYLAASKYFVLPAKFTPDMLEPFIKRREISLAGILRLEKDARFGKASTLFGAEKAASLAKRAGVDVTQCYGFYHQTPEATGEVIALWQDGSFKIVRLDDVGKLAANKSSTPTTNPTNNKSDPAKIAAQLPELEAAVKASPKDIGKRVAYAMALNQVGNYPAAWTQLRIAGQLDPKHSGIAKGLSAVFSRFAQQGLFIVGVPKETILSLLGKPDKEVDLNNRQRLMYSFFAIDFADGRVHEIIDARGITQATLQPREKISVSLDGRGWQCGYRKKDRQKSIALYFLPGETIREWNEQVELQRISGGAKSGSIAEIGQSMIKQLSQRFPGLNSKVLHSDENSVIVAFAYPASGRSKKQHELVRLLKGEDDLHRLSYRIKIDQPSQETQKKWLSIFKSAKLTPVAKP